MARRIVPRRLSHDEEASLVELLNELRHRLVICIVAIVTAFAILLPTVDPVSLVLETVPLLVLFELSIWIAVVMERRWERAAVEAL